MVMDLTEVRVLGILGVVVVALVTTVGAIALSLLAAGAVHAAFAVGGSLERLWGHAARGGRRDERAPTQARDRGFRLERGDHALLARQAWWRLRC
jgi:hypothetical protein